MSVRERKMKFGFVGAAILAAGTLAATTVTVDFDSVTGPVKPVNGVGQPPMLGAPVNYSMIHYLREAGIPYSRLHDVGGAYGQMRYVDIPNIFRDFDANEFDPKNYDFSYTDSLIKALMENGVEPFFRLGVTIENYVENGFSAYRVQPPKDFAKWARVCEHVIRHYTEGWANGFKYKITYWEIWNEPENRPDDESDRNPMWQARFSEYIRLYGTVAPYLKAQFPRCKIGGYASCGFYAGVGAGQVKAAHSSPRTDFFVTAAERFLTAVKKNGWPLDFFSYHSYSAPDEAMRQVRFADELLNRSGFPAAKTERIYNEWLPYVSHENLGTALQAAGVASELVQLQNGPCDLACVYDARCGIGNYSPLFNPMTYKPHKAYYAFVAFNELRLCGQAVKVSVKEAPKGFHVAAAKGEKGSAVMLVNDSGKGVEVVLEAPGRTVVSVRYTDADHTNESVSPDKLPRPTVLPPHAFAIVTLR